MLTSHLKTSEREPFPYALYTPQGFDPADGKKWPLVIFLHGAGEVGTDLEGVFVHGLPKRIRAGEEFPFIAAMPQMYPGGIWSCHIESLNCWLDFLLETLPVDADRVYATGLSMGGTGVWCWVSEYASRFAAVVPVCGVGIRFAASRMTDLPIWMFHGDSDPVVLPVESEMMNDGLIATGAREVRYTVYAGCGHDCWKYAYSDERMYEWLLSKNRAARPQPLSPYRETIR